MSPVWAGVSAGKADAAHERGIVNGDRWRWVANDESELLVPIADLPSLREVTTTNLATGSYRGGSKTGPGG
jgi:hypothetical protein